MDCEKRKDIYQAFEHIKLCLGSMSIGDKEWNNKLYDTIYYICDYLKDVYFSNLVEGLYKDIGVVVGCFNAKSDISYDARRELYETINDYMCYVVD